MAKAGFKPGSSDLSAFIQWGHFIFLIWWRRLSPRKASSQLIEGRSGTETQNSSLSASLCPTPHGLPDVPHDTWSLTVFGTSSSPPRNQKSSSSPSSAHREPGNPLQPLGGGQTSGSQLAWVWLLQPYGVECGLCVCLFFFSLLIIKLDNEADEWSPTRDWAGVLVLPLAWGDKLYHWGARSNFPICNTWGCTKWHLRSPSADLVEIHLKQVSTHIPEVKYSSLWSKI